MRFPSFLSFFLSPTTSSALWLTIHSKHLSGVCIVPKNPLISRFLSRLNFFKKNPCDENVHLNVTPFIPSSVYLWMDGRCKKNREHIDEKLLERYKYDSWDEGTRSLSVQVSFSLSIIFVSIVFHWNRYMKRNNIRSSEIRDIFNSSFRRYSINNNNNNCIECTHRFTRTFV